jgi:integrase/recombinase XerC
MSEKTEFDNIISTNSAESAISFTLSTLTKEYLAYIDGVRNLSSHTVSAYRNDLVKLIQILSFQKKNISKIDSSKRELNKKSFTHSVNVTEITLEDLRFCISILSKDNKSAASINQFIASVRNFFAYCHRFGYIKTNVALDLKTVKNPIKVPRFMTKNEVDVLCVQPETKRLLWASRDKALFEMLYSSGCRVSEIAALAMIDFSSKRDSAMITGKGGKDRRVYFSDQAVIALNEYLQERKEKLSRLAKTTNAVFISQKGTRITSGGIQYIVRRYSSVEGSNKPITPHAFRHTFATQLLNNGANIRVVQELLGHSSISTTQRYTHVTNKNMIASYNRAHPHSKKK